MELRDIEYFAVVAEHGHLGRAAESLGLSQPALSKSLRRLERALDVKLVKRAGRGIQLTAEGAALQTRALELKLSLANVAREISDMGQGRLGLLSVGTGPAVAEELLPGVATVLLSDAPRLKLKVIVSDNDVMLPALRSGELDVVVNYLPRAIWEGLVQERLYDDEFVVCAGAHHPLASRERVTFSDLSGQRWVLSEPNLHSQIWLERAFEARGLPPPRVAFETRSIRLRLQAVSSSDLLDFTSRRVVEEAARTFRLRELPVEDLPWRRAIGMLWRKDSYIAPSAQRLMNLLKSAARNF